MKRSFTVLLFNEEDLPLAHQVQAGDPLAAYMAAVTLQEEHYATICDDEDLPRSFTLEQACHEWPLVAVLDGHDCWKPLIGPRQAMRSVWAQPVTR